MSENLPFKIADGDQQDNAELKDSKGVIYLSLLQDLSKACKKKDAAYVEGAEPGMFLLSGVNELLGEETDVIVLDFYKYLVEVNPNDDTQIVGRYPEREGMKLVTNPGAWSGEWVTEEGNKMVLNYGYVLLIVGHEDVGKVMFSLKSSGIKIGQAWNNLLDRKNPDTGASAATYHQVFTLKSKTQTKGNNTWHVIDPQFKSWVNQEQYDNAFEVTKTLIPASEQLKVEDKSSDTETKTEEKVDY